MVSLSVCDVGGLWWHALEKFREDTPTSSKVIGAHTLNFTPNFKFLQLIFFFFGGGAISVGVCANKSWSISSACKNLRGQYLLMAEMSSPENCPLEWVNMHHWNFFVCGPKFTIFRPTWKGCGWSSFFSRFSICLSVPEIFAIKVESCQKSRGNLDVWTHKIYGAGLPKVVPTLSSLPRDIFIYKTADWKEKT